MCDHALGCLNTPMVAEARGRVELWSELARWQRRDCAKPNAIVTLATTETSVSQNEDTLVQARLAVTN